MSSNIWIRPLSKDETKYILEKQFENKNIFTHPMSIMGPENHIYIRSLNTEVWSYKVHLGNSQYIDESVWKYADPTAGIRIPVLWSKDTPYSYLQNECRKIGINILTKPYDSDILYIPTKFQAAIAEGFSYVDKSLYQYYEKQSLFSKWFGSIRPDYESPEAKAIRKHLQKILLNGNK